MRVNACYGTKIVRHFLECMLMFKIDENHAHHMTKQILRAHAHTHTVTLL